jgi:hypothetical protein
LNHWKSPSDYGSQRVANLSERQQRFNDRGEKPSRKGKLAPATSSPSSARSCRMPKIRTAPDFFGIDTAFTGGGTWLPELMRFQS